MKINSVYRRGKYNSEQVKLVAIGSLPDYPELGIQYQFEYVIPQEKCAGYSQSIEQVEKENYKLCKIGNLLYGELV